MYELNNRKNTASCQNSVENIIKKKLHHPRRGSITQAHTHYTLHIYKALASTGPWADGLTGELTG